MNAIDFLINEHEKVKINLAKISDTNHTEDARLKLFTDLCKDLLRHETMEHTVWYPHFKNNPKLSRTVKHLLKEENHAEKAIKSFPNIKNFNEWEAKFAKFKSDVEAHAKEEETLLFPEVKKLLSEEDLLKIGKAMANFKRDVLASLKE
jgi:hemerythrin superfamily protein